MRIAVIADSHGNLPALKAVLDDIKGHAVDQTVCLGDLAFTGPAPGQCVRMIQDLGIPCIYGNTDLALLHVAGPGPPRLYRMVIPFIRMRSPIWNGTWNG